MADAWRKAIFEYCELGATEIPKELITDPTKASRTQQTHNDDGLYVLYVQNLIAGRAKRMDVADFEMFKKNLNKTITRMMKDKDLKQRLKIIENKFIITKGQAIVCCANQHTLEITNMIVKNMGLPCRYKTSLSAFNETWALKFAFPADYEMDSPQETIDMLQVHNATRFYWPPTWPALIGMRNGKPVSQLDSGGHNVTDCRTRRETL